MPASNFNGTCKSKELDGNNDVIVEFETEATATLLRVTSPINVTLSPANADLIALGDVVVFTVMLP